MTVETVIAPGTPPGRSGLAVLRLSGPGCREIAIRFLRPNDLKPRRMAHGAWHDADGGAVLDRLNYVFYAAPKSPTGEDMLEVFPHGNPLLIERLMGAVLDAGLARLAEPGEFTRRSFENGKIDLVQAESVAQLVHAQNLGALRNAQRLLSGDLSRTLADLRDRLTDLSMRLELEVDFAEEEADPDYASWRARVEGMLSVLGKLAGGFAAGRELNRVPLVALCGAPNAGKSSLVNALLHSERVLVSERAGTTRDYVEVPFRLPGGLVHLVDTAGLGHAVDALDAAAMERTRSLLQRADCRVWLRDGAASPPDATLPAVGEDAREVDFDLRLATKCDLPGFARPEGFLSVSSATGEGLDELARLLDAKLFVRTGLDETPLLATERQYRAVDAARRHLEAALTHLEKHPAVEIAAFEVREARDALRSLLGEISADDVLRGIFAGFCIGK